MRYARAALVLAALAPAACAVQNSPPVMYRPAPSPMRLVETPTVPPPAHDISEADRMAWLDAHRPQASYVPSQDAPVEEDYSSCHDCGHGWGIGLPISIGLGYSSGCHGGGGFGVGVNVLGLGVGVGFGGW